MTLIAGHTLAELRAICERALRGPWAHSNDDMWAVVRGPTVTGVVARVSNAVDHDSKETTKATAAFIALSRQALPELIAALAVAVEALERIGDEPRTREELSEWDHADVYNHLAEYAAVARDALARMPPTRGDGRKVRR